MDKLLAHVHHYKKRITAHLKKHDKKYIFIAGTTTGICIFQTIAIILAFLGITMITGRSHAKDQKLEMEKVINVFYQIDELAHKEVIDYTKAGHLMSGELDEFESLDEKFHRCRNLNERYQVANELVDFLIKHQKMHDQMQDKETDQEDLARDEEFKQLLEVFHQIH